MILYHVTPASNLGTILACGINPACSRGARPVSWYCDRQRLGWALAHVARWQRVRPADLVIFRVRIPARLLTRTGRKGIYQCSRCVTDLQSVRLCFDADALHPWR